MKVIHKNSQLKEMGFQPSLISLLTGLSMLPLTTDVFEHSCYDNPHNRFFKNYLQCYHFILNELGHLE